MQQNEVYTLYKNYTSDIMQALKEKIDENNKLKEKININEKEIDSLKNQIPSLAHMYLIVKLAE